VPANYVIGPDDVLNVVFWRDQDMTREVTVRPDGKISLPVVNDLQASGLTPDQLRESIAKASARLYTDEPTVSIVVKQINSRKVFVTGGISKPGAYPLIGPMTIAQLIALAGGLIEYADQEHISVVSSDKKPDGTPFRYKFDYKQFLKGENLKQNIELKPGDTVIIPF
jgi:polysaccharide export outer membrane protein